MMDINEFNETSLMGFPKGRYLCTTRKWSRNHDTRSITWYHIYACKENEEIWSSIQNMHIKTIYWITEAEKFIFPLACNIWGGNMNKHFESRYWYVLNSSMSYLWVSNRIKGVTMSLDFWVQDPIVPQKPIHTKTFCELFWLWTFTKVHSKVERTFVKLRWRF